MTRGEPIEHALGADGRQRSHRRVVHAVVAQHDEDGRIPAPGVHQRLHQPADLHVGLGQGRRPRLLAAGVGEAIDVAEVDEVEVHVGKLQERLVHGGDIRRVVRR